jgi:hypothetical protein
VLAATLARLPRFGGRSTRALATEWDRAAYHFG